MSVFRRYPLCAVATLVAVLGIFGVTAWFLIGPRPVDRASSPTSPDSALAALVAGNRRYAESRRVNSTDTIHDADDRRELAEH